MSPYGLLQEEINADPWKIFICCIFCNLTKRVQAEPFFWKVIETWPTPEKLSEANITELENIIKPLGVSRRRALSLKKMSEGYIKNNWKDDPAVLYGIGKYASDAYRIFCQGDWRNVTPRDHALNDYHSWLSEKEKLSISEKNESKRSFNTK